MSFYLFVDAVSVTQAYIAPNERLISEWKSGKDVEASSGA